MDDDPTLNPWQAAQQTAHSGAFDYREGSPHLKHATLYKRLLGVLQMALTGVSWPPYVLDVGAGHGSFTEPLLAYGCRVVAVEMSTDSLNILTGRYGRNPNFSGILDQTGSLHVLESRRFDVILFASVLHHIPDYLGALERTFMLHLKRGGTVVTLQDPMSYVSRSGSTRAIAEVAYLSWRLGRGHLTRGLSSRWRRLSATYDDRNLSDLVEYHVVRQGVDQEAISALLTRHFGETRTIPYWSTQSAAWQRLGDRLHLANTFATVGSGFSPAIEGPRDP